jgi:hypothetical protein
MFKIYGGATKFTQWTKDQKLIMSELPIGADVLFYNDPNEDEPTITEVYEIHDEEGNAIRVCDVPNIFLTETKRIKVRIPKRVRGLYGTMHSIAGQNEKYFEVEPAEKPSDYVYEKTVTNTIDPKRLPEGYPWKEQGVTIEWDGTTDGRASIESQGTTYYKVSDLTPDLDGAKYKLTQSSVNSEGTLKALDTSGGVSTYTDTRFDDLILACVVNVEETESIENGTYFLYYGMEGNAAYTSMIDKSSVHTMSVEFLPEPTTEEWTFTLDDGSTVTKKVVVGK